METILTREVSDPWFAIKTRPRCEFQSRDELLLRSFDTFLPTRKVKRRWSDRTKVLDLPLFPGYLFCRFSAPQRAAVLNAPGVAHIVGAGSIPIPISDNEINSMQILISSKLGVRPWPYLELGQRVTIEHGPLAGVEGIIARADDNEPRVIVSVALLHRSVSAEIERDWIA